MACVALLVLVVVSSVMECGGYGVRGLDPRHKPRYHPGKDFTCLDGSDTIAFSMVNDDYCDCEDGSDEPGTAACPTGGFYCINIGHQPQTILSSRVNDGICDCCDGGDEWWGDISCVDFCEELGRKEEAKRKEREAMFAQGYQKRVQYEQQGIRSREDKMGRLDELKREEDRLKEEVERVREEKEAAEEPERLAKEEHEKKWEEEQAARQETEKAAEARAGFKQLDTDSDGYLTVAEIQQRSELDDDKDGEVSLEEALAYLDNEERVDETVFKDTVWAFVSDKITFEPPETEPPTAPPTATETPPTDEAAAEKEGDYEEDYDYEEEDADYKDQEGDGGDEEEGMPPYPEATQLLITAADAARDTFRKAERELGDVTREAGDIEKFLGVDLGSAMEFSPLYQQCYEFTDREYTYKLCAFDRVVQRSKSGGRETSLGTWVSWNGPKGSRYSNMLFENGEGCWNGPKRSTRVSVGCGIEEAILSASEPNRCEYAMEFVTPAVCPPPSTPGPGDTPGSHPNTPKTEQHQEL